MIEATGAPLDAQQQIERNYRWNFTVNTLDGATFTFGMSFFSSSIILPLFVSHFSSDPVVIGLISFLGWAGVLLPQLFTANLVERAPYKKFFPVTLGFFLERLPIFLVAPMTYFLASGQPILTLVLFFVLYTWHNLGAGLVAVGWQDMVAKVFPVEKRGRFFGVSNFLGNATGILGALVVPLVLDRYAFPLGYVYAFAATGGLMFLSWVFLSLTREPAVYSTKPAVSQLDYLRSLPDVLRSDRNFRTYLLAQILFALGWMANGFLAVYSAQTWNLPDAQAGAFLIALQVGKAPAYLVFGSLGDRKGHKRNIEICFVLCVLLMALAITAPNPMWFYAIFFLVGAAQAGLYLSGSAIVYEFTSAENRPTYIGLANTIPGIATTIAPLIGGWLARVTGYRSMFVVSLAFSVASWTLIHFAVREPRNLQA